MANPLNSKDVNIVDDKTILSVDTFSTATTASPSSVAPTPSPRPDHDNSDDNNETINTIDDDIKRF